MRPSDRTDAELLAAAEDDAAAFGQLYRRHVRRVHAWLDQRIAWAAADLTAETFARDRPHVPAADACRRMTAAERFVPLGVGHRGNTASPFDVLPLYDAHGRL